MNPAFSLLLLPISALYGVITRVRVALYRRGILRTESVEVPVISVGNITAGGTGKTPVVEWIARGLAAEGLSVCVLTRGYGRDNPKARVLASDGWTVRGNERETGDEAMLLAESLVGKAAVVCDANRVEAAKWAIRELGSEVLLLDDGFQHLRIARDLNIALVDATVPWGEGRMLPSGRLREPVGGLARADAVILTRSDQVEQLDKLRNLVSELSGDAPVFAARTTISRILELNGSEVGSTVEVIRGCPSLAFCGIGNPQTFFNQLRNEHWNVGNTQIFRDHHVYEQKDVDRLTELAKRNGLQTLITTAKDAIKLRNLKFTIECLVIEVKYEFDNEGALMDLILKAVSGKSQRSRLR
jgi:tetraacyldisaccharide 4'-kinase